MLKISHYNSYPDFINKTICALSEKCFYNKLRTNIIVNNETYMINIDKLLWTYSKKHFIPHAMQNDALLHLQPIIISTEIFEAQDFDNLIFIDLDQKDLKSIIEKSNFSFRNKKIIFINSIQIINEKNKLENFYKEIFKVDNADIEFFKQLEDGKWS